MSHNIYATFENRDAAERAAARMRRKGIAFRFSLQDGYDPGVSELRNAHASVSLLFPYHPPYYTRDYMNATVPRTIGKAVFTSDTLGLPLYPGGSATQVKITVDDEHLDDARSILHNCGAYDIR
ncbi:MAG: hypothetical protein PUB32_05880 [Clostridiales bacterium]|nr:hypothetical protein [Clostridiales bacterium]